MTGFSIIVEISQDFYRIHRDLTGSLSTTTFTGSWVRIRLDILLQDLHHFIRAVCMTYVRALSIYALHLTRMIQLMMPWAMRKHSSKSSACMELNEQIQSCKRVKCL
jgi:hypothetical protein